MDKVKKNLWNKNRTIIIYTFFSEDVGCSSIWKNKMDLRRKKTNNEVKLCLTWQLIKVLIK